MKSVIHVHQQKIKKNETAIIVRNYKGSKHYRKVEIKGPSTIIHSDEPDRCGARVWIETDAEVIGYDEKES